jgi:hypothetical protein
MIHLVKTQKWGDVMSTDVVPRGCVQETLGDGPREIRLRLCKRSQRG